MKLKKNLNITVNIKKTKLNNMKFKKNLNITVNIKITKVNMQIKKVNMSRIKATVYNSVKVVIDIIRMVINRIKILMNKRIKTLKYIPVLLLIFRVLKGVVYLALAFLEIHYPSLGLGIFSIFQPTGITLNILPEGTENIIPQSTTEAAPFGPNTPSTEYYQNLIKEKQAKALEIEQALDKVGLHTNTLSAYIQTSSGDAQARLIITKLANNAYIHRLKLTHKDLISEVQSLTHKLNERI